MNNNDIDSYRDIELDNHLNEDEEHVECSVRDCECHDVWYEYNDDKYCKDCMTEKFKEDFDANMCNEWIKRYDCSADTVILLGNVFGFQLNDDVDEAITGLFADAIKNLLLNLQDEIIQNQVVKLVLTNEISNYYIDEFIKFTGGVKHECR